MTPDRLVPPDVDVDLVIPTIGRPSLQRLLGSLAANDPLPAGRILVVDDRTERRGPLVDGAPAARRLRIEVVVADGRGPAAARNAGWRASRATWIAFLDDDVVVPTDWVATLLTDLAGTTAAASQGRVEVPMPVGRRPTDWERNVAGLETARWATADMAYRRSVLLALGGFDERFPRAYREDADLGLRVVRAGHAIVQGNRRVVHPVRDADAWVSLRLQAGNGDDPFMQALHGAGWRTAAGVPPGRRPWHVVTVGAALAGLAAYTAGRRRAAGVVTGLWLGLTGALAWHRIAPGPRTVGEVARMLATSVALPFAATWHWLRGWVSLPARLQRPGPQPCPAAVLFDRDGTLVHDVPYNGDPARVQPVPTAAAALGRLRHLGIPTALVTNQSGIARGLLDPGQVDDVNREVERLLGRLGPIEVCPHGPRDGCRCRKPRPGLIQQACRRLGVDPRDCAVIGDTAADLDAAAAAGALGVLVPNEVTRREEIADAERVAGDLLRAVDLVLRARSPRGGWS